MTLDSMPRATAAAGTPFRTGLLRLSAVRFSAVRIAALGPALLLGLPAPDRKSVV